MLQRRSCQECVHGLWDISLSLSLSGIYFPKPRILQCWRWRGVKVKNSKPLKQTDGHHGWKFSKCHNSLCQTRAEPPWGGGGQRWFLIIVYRTNIFLSEDVNTRERKKILFRNWTLIGPVKWVSVVCSGQQTGIATCSAFASGFGWTSTKQEYSLTTERHYIPLPQLIPKIETPLIPCFGKIPTLFSFAAHSCAPLCCNISKITWRKHSLSSVRDLHSSTI